MKKKSKAKKAAWSNGDVSAAMDEFKRDFPELFKGTLAQVARGLVNNFEPTDAMVDEGVRALYAKWYPQSRDGAERLVADVYRAMRKVQP